MVEELDLSVLAFTNFPCFFFDFVVLFSVLVVDVVPEGSDTESVEVEDFSVVTFRPLSEVVVAVVVEESLDCVVCASMAAAVIKVTMIIFIPEAVHFANRFPTPTVSTGTPGFGGGTDCKRRRSIGNGRIPARAEDVRKNRITSSRHPRWPHSVR